MTGQRSLAEIEAKLDLSDVRYWAACVSPIVTPAGLRTYVSGGRIPLLLYSLNEVFLGRGQKDVQMAESRGDRGAKAV